MIVEEGGITPTGQRLDLYRICEQCLKRERAA
jgi:hypothetical protein